MKSIAFWALDATVLFALSLLYLHQGYHRKNPMFAVWLCNGVGMQLIAAWALAAGPPPWVTHLRVFEDIVTYVLSAGVLATAATRRSCPVNRSLLWGVGAMVALNLFSRYLGAHVDHTVQVWLRNIAFFGPAIFLLIALSNIRLDMLPLWITSVFRSTSNRWIHGPAWAATGLLGAFRARRQ
ncbi:MAG TPA: hypothetical protein VL523_09040 [Terriglobia bacterium]|nr:hypothetical protein [Terriglobia bacterium]